MKNYNLSQHFRRSLPTILTSLGVIGAVASTVMAVKATPKALELLEEAEREKGETLTIEEEALTAAPVYIPTLFVGMSAIACIFGANALNKRAQASLASSYALLSSYHKAYRSKLIELKGKEADIEVTNSMAREHCNVCQINSDAPDREVVFYDKMSDRYFRRYEREVMDAEYHLNRNFVLRGYTTLNEFYAFLGLPETKQGNELGWTASDGYYWVDFEHRPVKGKSDEAVYVIDMLFEPIEGYADDYI